MKTFDVEIVREGKESSTAVFELRGSDKNFIIQNCHNTVNLFWTGHKINSYHGSYTYTNAERTCSCIAFLQFDDSKRGVLSLFTEDNI